MAFGAAPRMARCEQKVCRSTCDPMRRKPASLEACRSAASMPDRVSGAAVRVTEHELRPQVEQGRRRLSPIATEGIHPAAPSSPDSLPRRLCPALGLAHGRRFAERTGCGHRRKHDSIAAQAWKRGSAF